MPGARHCRHCLGDCPGNCLLPGGGGLCINRPAPKLTVGQRLALDPPAPGGGGTIGSSAAPGDPAPRAEPVYHQPSHLTARQDCHH